MALELRLTTSAKNPYPAGFSGRKDLSLNTERKTLDNSKESGLTIEPQPLRVGGLITPKGCDNVEIRGPNSFFLNLF